MRQGYRQRFKAADAESRWRIPVVAVCNATVSPTVSLQHMRCFMSCFIETVFPTLNT